MLQGFQEQRRFLLLTTMAKKPATQGPDMSVFESLMRPMTTAINDTADIKDQNRQSPFCDHLTAVADGILALAWVTVPAKPHQHVTEMYSSAQFFGNRVVKSARAKYAPCPQPWRAAVNCLGY